MRRRRYRRTLAIDIGGTHVKLRLSNRASVCVFDSAATMTPVQFMRQVRKVTREWAFDRVSVGYPGMVIDGRIVAEPVNLGHGWTGFDFSAAFDCPVQILNDAVMQAIGAYERGRMLYVSFGTALGAVAILDASIHAMELGHIPFNKHATVQAFVGDEALRRLGRARWSRNALAVIRHLSGLLDVQRVVIGGGNATRLRRLPPRGIIAAETAAFDGGFTVWRRPLRPAS